ncbi:fungal-specific transcription factor domain-containing protein [Aspergillus californicus]
MRLPACHACYTKKIKCDNNRPKCAPCHRNNSECASLAIDGHQSVSRGYITELEEKARALQRGLQDADVESPTTRLTKLHRRSRTKVTSFSPDGYSFNSNSFMRPLFTDPGWRANNPTVLHELSQSTRLVEATIAPNPLPPADTARGVFDRYLTGTHVLNPFLLRREIEDVYQAVFLADSPSPHALFRAFMLLAIGSIHCFRTGAHQWHPYGYFLAAMQHFKSDFLSRAIGSIQDLLLIARFGIYHHIGTSIWEITQLCMRLCVEQGLHDVPTSQKPLVQEQLERRVFWECYVIDRYSSITLDRPLAIADCDIRVPLPVDASDDQLEAAEGSVELNVFQIVPGHLTNSTDLSAFFLCIRLRQITSKIHSLFQFRGPPSLDSPSATAPGRIYSDLYSILDELDEWRRSAPVFDQPKCLYESQQWYDLRWMRERLLLVRKAMDLVPKRNNIPPPDLLALCLEYAIGTITIFCPLYDGREVTYTRSYFQTLFTAGLSVVFYLSVVTDLSPSTVSQATGALGQCERVLGQMGYELPDAAQYVAVYEALYRHILHKLAQGHASRMTLEQSRSRNNPIDNYRDHQTLLDINDDDSSHLPLPTSVSLPPGDMSTVDLSNEMLSFGSLFWDDTLWNMEAGLGEYAYGNPLDIPAFDEGMFQL